MCYVVHTMPTPTKRGRAVNTEPEQRSELINVRLTPEEDSAFREAARAQGLALSVWIRSLCRDAAGMNRQRNERKG